MLNENSRRELRMQERVNELFKELSIPANEHFSVTDEAILTGAMLAAEEEELTYSLQSEYRYRVVTSGTTQPLWSILLGVKSPDSFWLSEVAQPAKEGIYITPSRGGIPARINIRVIDILCLRTGVLTRQYLAEMPCRKIGIFPSANAMLLGIYSQYSPAGYDFCDVEDYEMIWGKQND